ncbi:MAG: hypothetical protein ACFFDN_46880 [Candidatus Hodarchaeota archaeon]
MNKKDDTIENLILKVFSSSPRYSWKTALKKKYFYKLRSLKGLSKQELPEKTFEKDPSEILSKIEQYDDEYKLFIEFHKLYESHEKKVIELFQLKSFTENEKNYIINELKNSDYDLTGKDYWTPICIERDENNAKIVIVTLGKSSLQKIKTPLIKKDVTNEVWIEIEKSAIKKIHTGDQLIQINASMTAAKRDIIKITINLENDTMNITRDNFMVDESGRPYDSDLTNSEKNEAVKKVAEVFKLKESKDDFIKTPNIEEQNILTETIFKDLHGINEDTMLIVHTRERYKSTDEKISQLSEDVTSKLDNQKISHIISKSKDLYDKKGSLKGFFQEYPEHQSSKAKYISILETDAFAARTAYSAHAIFIREKETYDKQIKNIDNYLKEKVIDYITFDYDYNNRLIEIKNPNYSKYAYESFIQKIHEIYQQQT